MPQVTYEILGQDLKPLRGARIITDYAAPRGSDGNGYAHTWAPTGEHRADITMDGRKQRTKRFLVRAGNTEHFRIVLPEADPPPPDPGPPPGDPLTPVRLGDWSSSFLHPERLPNNTPAFFGPACAAFPATRRRDYFQHLVMRGYTDVLINADQDDWGPRREHPEWTAGGFWALGSSNGLAFLVSVLIEARQAGLVPMLGLIDQPRAKSLSGAVDELVRLSQILVDATHMHVGCYLTTWESDEVWANGGVREPALEAWIGDVDWRGRDVGIHYADGLRGGNLFYGRLNQVYPGHVVRLMQWPASHTTSQLAHDARLVAQVAAQTGTKICAFEHSSPVNQNPTHTEAEAAVRADACLTAIRAVGLAPDRFGSMNG